MGIASLICFAFAVFCLLMASGQFWLNSVLAPIESRVRKPSELVGLILSIMGQRSGWTLDTYRLSHATTDIDIWVASTQANMQVSVGDGVGKIISGGGNVTLRRFERYRIWQAVGKHRQGLNDEKIIDFAQRAEAFGLKLKAEHEAKRLAEDKARLHLKLGKSNQRLAPWQQEWQQERKWNALLDPMVKSRDD